MKLLTSHIVVSNVLAALLGTFIAIGALCVYMVGASVVHDLSDGKVDGTRYVNGCP